MVPSRTCFGVNWAGTFQEALPYQGHGKVMHRAVITHGILVHVQLIDLRMCVRKVQDRAGRVFFRC